MPRYQPRAPSRAPGSRHPRGVGLDVLLGKPALPQLFGKVAGTSCSGSQGSWKNRHVPGAQPLGAVGEGPGQRGRVRRREHGQGAGAVRVRARERPGGRAAPVVADDVRALHPGCVEQGRDVGRDLAHPVRRPRAGPGAGGVAALVRRQGPEPGGVQDRGDAAQRSSPAGSRAAGPRRRHRVHRSLVADVEGQPVALEVSSRGAYPRALSPETSLTTDASPPRSCLLSQTRLKSPWTGRHAVDAARSGHAVPGATLAAIGPWTVTHRGQA